MEKKQLKLIHPAHFQQQREVQIDQSYRSLAFQTQVEQVIVHWTRNSKEYSQLQGFLSTYHPHMSNAYVLRMTTTLLSQLPAGMHKSLCSGSSELKDSHQWMSHSMQLPQRGGLATKFLVLPYSTICFFNGERKPFNQLKRKAPGQGGGG